MGGTLTMHYCALAMFNNELVAVLESSLAILGVIKKFLDIHDCFSLSGASVLLFNFQFALSFVLLEKVSSWQIRSSSYGGLVTRPAENGQHPMENGKRCT